MGERRQVGVGLFGQLLGGEQETALRKHMASTEFGKECATWAAEFEFGTVWARPGLEQKLRSCAVIAMMIAQRQTEELKYHVRIALANGLTVTELEELLYLSVPYVGFPAANSARQAMMAALEEWQAGQAE